ncbi:MAG: hypothetical protein PHN78_05515 [Dehalococcoidales bacterium]|nr:hypothetical protein [Dehalococcoidales bacterium]
MKSDTRSQRLKEVALFLVFRFKINSVWLVLGGGALGVIYKLIIR